MESKMMHSDTDDKHLEKNLDITEVPAAAVAADGKAVPVDEHGVAHIEVDLAVQRKLLRKMDLRLLAPLWLMYFVAFLDRTNLGNARLANLEGSLNFPPTGYNVVASVFFVGYIIFSGVGNIPAKIIGPHIWLPLCCTVFGILTLSTTFVQSYGGFVAVRFLLGCAEAPFFPGIAFVNLARWYKKEEHGLRIAISTLSVPFAGGFGGLIASAVFRHDSIGAIREWRQLYLVEGILSTAIGLLCFVIMPKSLETAKWLTEEERALGIARLKAQNAGTTTHVERINMRSIKEGFFSVNTFAIGFWYLLTAQAMSVVNYFLPTIIRQLFPGSSTSRVQLLTVPPYLIGGIPMVGLNLLAIKIKSRGAAQSIGMGIGGIGWLLLLVTTDANSNYAGTFLGICGVFPGASLAFSWSSANVGTDTGRAIAIGTTGLLSNIGNLIGTWTVLPQYAPRQIPAQAINFTFNCVVVVTCVGLILYNRRENRLRERGGRDYRLEGLSEDEQAKLGRFHPRFRYQY